MNRFFEPGDDIHRCGPCPTRGVIVGETGQHFRGCSREAWRKLDLTMWLISTVGGGITCLLCSRPRVLDCDCDMFTLKAPHDQTLTSSCHKVTFSLSAHHLLVVLEEEGKQTNAYLVRVGATLACVTPLTLVPAVRSPNNLSLRHPQHFSLPLQPRRKGINAHRRRHPSRRAKCSGATELPTALTQLSIQHPHQSQSSCTPTIFDVLMACVASSVAMVGIQRAYLPVKPCLAGHFG